MRVPNRAAAKRQPDPIEMFPEWRPSVRAEAFVAQRSKHRPANLADSALLEAAECADMAFWHRLVKRGRADRSTHMLVAGEIALMLAFANSPSSTDRRILRGVERGYFESEGRFWAARYVGIADWAEADGAVIARRWEQSPALWASQARRVQVPLRQVAADHDHFGGEAVQAIATLAFARSVTLDLRTIARLGFSPGLIVAAGADDPEDVILFPFVAPPPQPLPILQGVGLRDAADDAAGIAQP
jgi:hypothetical protein